MEGEEGDVLEQPETIDHLSSIVSNATEFLNLPGIRSPILEELGVRVEILTDDMAASDALKTFKNETNGNLELFVKPMDTEVDILGANQLVLGFAFFAFSFMVL